jgi:phosphoribosylglycinamide formyltransferase 1
VKKKNIVIFASGSGSNAEEIIKYFQNSDKGRIAAIFSNKPDAFVLQRAEKYGIPTEVFTRKQFFESQLVLSMLQKYETDLIVLAGFLLLVPEYLVKEYPGRIINIHPALLPAYGGKGMYGSAVHEAVHRNGERYSGITIHFVNNNYDEGKIILQEKCEITSEDSPSAIAGKVLKLEHYYYPRVIEKVIENL